MRQLLILLSVICVSCGTADDSAALVNKSLQIDININNQINQSEEDFKQSKIDWMYNDDMICYYNDTPEAWFVDCNKN